MRADHPVLPYLEWISARQPVRVLKGLLSAHLAYPVAEHMEKRLVRPKLGGLHRYYRAPFEQRLPQIRQRVADTVAFAMRAVPYYRDTLTALNFDPSRLARDLGFLQDIPYLTKDIIREQGERLLSRPLAEVRHHRLLTMTVLTQ